MPSFTLEEFQENQPNPENPLPYIACKEKEEEEMLLYLF